MDEEVINAACTFSRELVDLQSVFSYVREYRVPFNEQLDADRIALLGHSRAGASNIVFAAEHPEIVAVVAWNAAVSLALLGNSKQESAISADLENNEERFNIPGQLASLAMPALVVQGERDSMRFLHGNQRLREFTPHHKFEMFQGADHNFGISHPFCRTTPQLKQTLEVTHRFLLHPCNV